MLAVWQQAGRFAGSGSAAGWLRRIVRNKAIDWLRRQRETLLPAEAFEEAAGHVLDPALNAADMAERESDRIALIKALEGLSLEHREAIWLCYFEELSVREIAEIAGCPVNTVKTRLHHARRILRGFKILKFDDSFIDAEGL